MASTAHAGGIKQGAESDLAVQNGSRVGGGAVDMLNGAVLQQDTWRATVSASLAS